MTPAEKLHTLRLWMAQEQLAAFVLPMADEFLSEYVPPHAMRLAWLTGFDGSAGTAVITQDKAMLFTDGRYTIQAEQQLDMDCYEVINISYVKLLDWLAQAAEAAPVGYDPMLHSTAWADAAAQANIHLKAVDANPIDAWWQDRPAQPKAPAWEYPLAYAGKGSVEKRTEITAAFAKHSADALLISAAENIAWLLNIRGADLECTPVLQAYALLYADGGVQLFTNPEKMPPALVENLERVQVLPLAELAAVLSALSGKTLLVNVHATPAALVHHARQVGLTVVAAMDPIEHAKAIKNKAELTHMRNVHMRDGAALVKSFCELDRLLAAGEAVDEMRVDALLNANRAATEGYISLSFPAIVGAGGHGAIVHYRVTRASNQTLAAGELLLIDSGGQYLGGTTDVTRTLAIGTPSAQQKKHYTLVLKGHIALANAVFPVGTPGSQLDVLARQFLWAEGLDYDHGTGHGVGACLNVHEGPQGISKRSNVVPLLPGMILSNEPGYYLENEYGIRIENLVEVIERQPGFLGFSNLTLVPYARDLIDLTLLSADELAYVNRYHQQVKTQLTARLNAEEQAWLDAQCQPIS